MEKKSLLILGAGIYSAVVYEIAMDSGEFSEIAFLDDSNSVTPFGGKVEGKISELGGISKGFTHAIAAIGNPDVRFKVTKKIEEETDCRVAVLVSPRAYVSKSATLGEGCVVEPMAVVHSCCSLGKGCLVSAGAVINHAAVCSDYVHVDCNGTVEGFAHVPEKTKVYAGTVFCK